MCAESHRSTAKTAPAAVPPPATLGVGGGGSVTSRARVIPARIARLAFVLAVLAGVVLMHSLVASTRTSDPGHPAAFVTAAGTDFGGIAGAADPAEDCGSGSECSESGVLRVCTVILAGMVSGAAAGALRRAIAVLRIGSLPGPSPQPVEQEASRSWLMPSLTELSILRQ